MVLPEVAGLLSLAVLRPVLVQQDGEPLGSMIVRRPMDLLDLELLDLLLGDVWRFRRRDGVAQDVTRRTASSHAVRAVRWT